MTPQAPRVSVAMVTYNHEGFLEQAVQSVLMQQAEFPFELVLSEDCSTDGTRELAIELQRRHPSVIRLLLSSENVGAVRNFMRTLKACRGEYVALLDGDDYWTSPRKLQTQVALLDGHPELAMCYHDVLTFEEGRPGSRRISARHRSISTLEDLFRVTPPSCSVMFRRGLFGKFPQWFETVGMFDWPLHVLNAQHGEIGFLDEVMAAHRKHGGGVYSSLGKVRRLQDRLQIYACLDRHFGGQYREIIRRMVSKSHYAMALEYESAGDRPRARAQARKSVLVCPSNRELSLSKVSATLFRLHLPAAHRLVQSIVRAVRSVAPAGAR